VSRTTLLIVLALILGLIGFIYWTNFNRYTLLVPSRGTAYKLDKKTGEVWVLRGNSIEKLGEPQSTPSVQKQDSKEEIDTYDLGKEIDELIRVGVISEDKLNGKEFEKEREALEEYRRFQEFFSFPIDLLEFRNTHQTKVYHQGIDYDRLEGSIYNKSESFNATQIKIRFYYYRGDKLVNTEDILLEQNNSPLYVGATLTKFFQIRLSNYDSYGGWDKIEYKIVSAQKAE
jgi:hypothetical protein